MATRIMPHTVKLCHAALNIACFGQQPCVASRHVLPSVPIHTMMVCIAALTTAASVPLHAQADSERAQVVQLRGELAVLQEAKSMAESLLHSYGKEQVCSSTQYVGGVWQCQC